jgi:cell fate regulator YaaT (PSP1 superfamily)
MKDKAAYRGGLVTITGADLGLSGEAEKLGHVGVCMHRNMSRGTLQRLQTILTKLVRGEKI